MITLELPFPPHELSPNSRLHWAKKVSPRRAYRAECWIIGAKAKQKYGALIPPVEAELFITLPDNRRRDEDNLKASLKAAWDGLVDSGLLEDDRIGMLSVTRTSVAVVKGQSGVIVRLRSVASSETALSTSSRNAEED